MEKGRDNDGQMQIVPMAAMQKAKLHSKLQKTLHELYPQSIQDSVPKPIYFPGQEFF